MKEKIITTKKNKRKRVYRILTCLLVLGICCVNTNPSVSAEEHEKEYTVFQFEAFKYVDYDIAPDSYIEHKIDGLRETYTVFDRETGVITDILSAEMKNSAKGSNITNTLFTKDKNVYGGGQNVVTLRFTANMQLYSNGSFRSFQGLNYTNVSILSAVTSMEFSGTPSSSCNPHTGSYPCTRVDFAYTANVRTTGTVSTTIGGYLISAGFSQTSYYYKIINGSGYFSLY